MNDSPRLSALISERDTALRENALVKFELAKLRLVVAEWEKLRDPVNLHANLLRGLPAKLSTEMLLHIIGDAPVAIMDKRDDHRHRNHDTD